MKMFLYSSWYCSDFQWKVFQIVKYMRGCVLHVMHELRQLEIQWAGGRVLQPGPPTYWWFLN